MALDLAFDLETLAEGKPLEDTKWPPLLDALIPRIEAIATKEFPIPRIPLPQTPPPSTDTQTTSQDDSAETSEPPEKRPRLRSRSRSPKSTSEPILAQTNTSSTIAPPPDTLPPQLLSLIQTIQSTLKSNFPTSPPHTSQRLAELILQPRRHYKSLPSYLRALDRIVTVASPLSAYPLPSSGALGNGNTDALFNGTTSPAKDQNDKDFIGGAELTPIPWLRDLSTPVSPSLTASDLHTESTSMIDGPNGAGSIETVSVNMNGVLSARSSFSDQPVTQGELIRQEQEAGIAPVPATRSIGGANDAQAGGADGETKKDDDEEQVHARGPNLIGMEDLGPQAVESGLAEGIKIEEQKQDSEADRSDKLDSDGADPSAEAARTADGQKEDGQA